MRLAKVPHPHVCVIPIWIYVDQLSLNDLQLLQIGGSYVSANQISHEIPLNSAFGPEPSHCTNRGQPHGGVDFVHLLGCFLVHEIRHGGSENRKIREAHATTMQAILEEALDVGWSSVS